MSSRNRTKKTLVEAKKYRLFVQNINENIDGTITPSNSMLQGSNEIDHNKPIEIPEDIQKKPLKYIITDWIKKHLVATIIAPLLIAFISFLFINCVNNNMKLNNIEYKVSEIENRIDRLENNIVDKNLLNEKLENIKSEINNESLNNLKDIEWQLKILEDKVDRLEENN